MTFSIDTLNRTYCQLVAERALSVLPSIGNWIGQQVNVFLRHDAQYVFAIHHHPQIGMANVVQLNNARFTVDAGGRLQTLQKAGPLPNKASVHAFVSGQLADVSDDISSLDSSMWWPVVYRPDTCSHFMTSEQSADAPEMWRAVLRADRVLMIPGPIKVWCQRPALIQCDRAEPLISGGVR